MVKNEVWKIYLVLFGLLVLFCGCFFVYIFSKSNNGDIIDLTIEDGCSESVEFERLGLLPGDCCSYTLRLNIKTPGKYKIALDFNTIRNNLLDDYIYAKILVGGRTLKDALLCELLEEDAEVITYILSSSFPEPIDIIYYMPEDVGNEAMGAWTSFELLITASLDEE